MSQDDHEAKVENALRFGPLGATTAHLCVDMQDLFAGDTAWHTPSIARVTPQVVRLARAHPAQTVFTRFIPARNAAAAPGSMQRYYECWASVTGDVLDPATLDLVAPLRAFAPPGIVFDKTTYSPWVTGALDWMLKARTVDTVVVTGGETGVCVLATVLGAVDAGYRTLVATDALWSSSDEAHDAMVTLYEDRYGLQVETVTTEDVLGGWA